MQADEVQTSCYFGYLIQLHFKHLYQIMLEDKVEEVNNDTSDNSGIAVSSLVLSTMNAVHRLNSQMRNTSGRKNPALQLFYLQHQVIWQILLSVLLSVS